MTSIELSPFDKDDLIKYLEYAKEQKLKNRPELKGNQKWDDTNYDVMRINYLLDITKGRVRTGGVVMESALPTQGVKEKEQYRTYLETQAKENAKNLQKQLAGFDAVNDLKEEPKADDDLLDFLYEEEEEPWWKN